MPAVVSKISIAVPVALTLAGAVAVRTTPWPACIADALALRLSFWCAAAGCRDAIGTLGETIGDSAGVPLWEAAKGVVSMQAAGVLEEVLESDGHAVRPSGVEATPAATLGDPALVTQAAPSPEPGHG